MAKVKVRPLASGTALGSSVDGRLWRRALAPIIFLTSAFVSWPVIDGSFQPDTVGYIEYSQYRQPMYGLWANTIFQISGSWQTAQYLQVAAFMISGIWALVEIAFISSFGNLAAVLLAVAWGTLNRFGLLSLVAELISEGLFFPLILLAAALLIRWVRVGNSLILVPLTLVILSMGQLRTAAMLLFTVPLVIACYLVVRHWREPRFDRSAVALFCGLSLGALLLPSLTGKPLLQFGTTKDSIGSVVLPRVSLLPVPEAVASKSPDWATMASSWRKAAGNLGGAAFTQFDAQLQETVRFDLAPHVLLPAVLNLPQQEVSSQWASGGLYDDAKRIAASWIRLEWPSYVRHSGLHLWGMMTMANFIGNADREKVWTALQEVDPSTWRVAPMRTDYPLNQIGTPLKWHTELVYRLIRCGSMVIIVLGLLSAVIVARQSLRGQFVSRGNLAVALAIAWCLAHSIPAAFMVFPEYRYTYANLLVLLTGGAVWLAYSGLAGCVGTATVAPKRVQVA